MTATNRCAMYARFSPKPEGAAGENYSIGSQVDAMREVLVRDFSCAAPVEYVDKNISGATLDRPALDKLRDAVADKLYDVVIVYSPDRLARDLTHALLLLKEFKKNKVRLVFVSGSYEDSPQGKFGYTVLAAAAELEKELFAERSRRGRKRKAADGFVHSSVPPFGYKYFGHKFKRRGELEVMPEQAKTVRRIFEETARGKSAYAVAMGLNADGVKTQKGGRWFRQSVTQVLEKTAHYGEVAGPSGIIVPVPSSLAGDTGEKTTWDAAGRRSARALWDAAHRAMARNRIGRAGRPSLASGNGKGYSRQYLLSGYLWCAKCGKRAVTKPAPGLDGSYRCGNMDNTTHKHLCEERGILKSKLEALVWNALWDALTDPALLWELIDAYYERMAAPPTTKKEAALLRLERAERRVARAEAILSDPDSPVGYEQAKATLKAARQELVEAETAAPSAARQRPARGTVEELARAFQRTRELEKFERRRAIIAEVVEKIRWNGTRREVEISCSIPVAAEKNCNKRVRANCNTLAAISFVITRRLAA